MSLLSSAQVRKVVHPSIRGARKPTFVGWHGLAMGRTYLEINPKANVLIIDSASTVGGVWAKERLYPGLRTNNLLGTYEFSDFPMTCERFGAKPGEHIPGEVVHEYLSQFVDHFNLRSRLRLGKRVTAAELLDDGKFLLRLAPPKYGKPDGPELRSILTDRLVIATGLTSEPHIPSFHGEDKFNREIFHVKELRQRSDSLSAAREVVVLGGNKSAWDTCYAAAQQGAQVHMVIRPGGGGPSFLWPIFISPLKISVQRVAATRIFTWFDPCIWAEHSGWIGRIRRFLHQTFVGRKLVTHFWMLLQYLAHNLLHYDDDFETRKLKPWVNPFWMGNSLSIHNYPTPWLNLVREGKIKVHIADVTELSEGVVHLSDDVKLRTDVLICCTGWKARPPLKFLPEHLPSILGLEDDSDKEMVRQARSEVLTRIPAFRTGPERRTLTPGMQHRTANQDEKFERPSRYQLYRFVVPSTAECLARRNVAFVGAHLALHAVMIAQLQALWVTAFFMNEMPHLQWESADLGKIYYETVLHNEYTRIRHPHVAGGVGERCPDLTFDCLPYMDLLGKDLGLRKFRKSSIWAEVFHRYTPADYQNMIEEWSRTRKKVKTSM